MRKKKKNQSLHGNPMVNDFRKHGVLIMSNLWVAKLRMLSILGKHDCIGQIWVMYIAVLKSVHFPYRFTRLYKFSEKTYKRIFFAEKNYRRINYQLSLHGTWRCDLVQTFTSFDEITAIKNFTFVSGFIIWYLNTICCRIPGFFVSASFACEYKQEQDITQ